MWADFEYYETEFRVGAPVLIPEELFPFWEKQSRTKINWRKVEIDDPPDYLKDAVCAVAERLYLQSQAIASSPDADGNTEAPIGSFSNDGYSVTYRDTMKQYRDMSQADIDAEIRGIAADYLTGTPLHNAFIYRGGV